MVAASSSNRLPQQTIAERFSALGANRTSNVRFARRIGTGVLAGGVRYFQQHVGVARLIEWAEAAEVFALQLFRVEAAPRQPHAIELDHILAGEIAGDFVRIAPPRRPSDDHSTDGGQSARQDCRIRGLRSIPHVSYGSRLFSNSGVGCQALP